jgi:VWFA-related protein
LTQKDAFPSCDIHGTVNRRGFLFGLGAFLTAGRLVRAQEPATTVKVTSRLVNVYVTVRDKKGAIVQSLKREDFAVAEDGKPQAVTFFSHENDLPLTLGLLVDTSPSEAAMIDQEREASRLFFDTVLDPKKDRAFVIHFDREVDLLQDLTNSLPKLDDALNKLDASSDEPRLNRKRGGDQGDEQNGGPDRDEDQDGDRGGRRQGGRGDGGGSTHLFDAVYLAATQVLKGQSGRKAVIVVGDGDDMGSKVTKSRAIRAAQENDVLVYCIRIVDKDFGKEGRHHGFSMPGGMGIPGMGGPMGGPGGGGHSGPGGGGGRGEPSGGMDRADGKKNMEALAGETGGALFEVSKKTSLSDVYAQIREELRGQYSLGYTPAAGAEAGYRRIHVTVPKHDNFKVQARDGYYSGGE